MLTNEKEDTKKRTRCFTFELYEESAPQNFREELQSLHIKTAYCLHDKDVYSETDYNNYKTKHNGEEPNFSIGSKKKSHFHLVFKFDTVKSINQVLDILKPFNVHFVQIVRDERLMLRYLIHLDNAEKYQYSREDLKTLNNYNINHFFENDKDQNEIKQELRKIIFNDNSDYTFNFYSFYFYILNNYSYEYLNVIDKYSYLFNNLILAKHKYNEEAKIEAAYKQLKEEKQTQEQKDLEEDYNKVAKIKRQEREQKILNMEIALYEQNEKYKKLYLKLKDKPDLTATERIIKHNIENFFIKYAEEMQRQEFSDLIDQQKELEQEQLENKIG